MKIFYLAVISCLFVLFACNTDPEENPYQDENEKLYKEIQQLRLDEAGKDSSFNAVLQQFNEIEDNLIEIKRREGIISTSTDDKTEVNADQKERIIQDIQMINSLIKENKGKLEKMRALLKSKGLEIMELEKMIARMTETIASKDKEISGLKAELSEMKISYKLLAMESKEKSELIKMQKDELNTAYYCYGSKKELRKNGVLSKEGGIIGIGSSNVLSKDFNASYFTQLDTKETSEIPLNVAKLKLVTNHPSASYELLENEDGSIASLKILKPNEFWSVSKFLVMTTD